MYTHVEKLPAILRYKIIFTYDVPAITGHFAFGIQGPPGLSLGGQVGDMYHVTLMLFPHELTEDKRAYLF
jgi:hypothetical protein